jgi:hypothetical protein
MVAVIPGTSNAPPSRIGITPPADPTAWMDDLTTMHEDRRFDALHNSPDVASLSLPFLPNLQSAMATFRPRSPGAPNRMTALL